MEREGQLVDVGLQNANPIVVAADSRIVFDNAAPELATHIVNIMRQRLTSVDTTIQDAGIEIASKFKKQLFSDKPTTSVHLQVKTGAISAEAQQKIYDQLSQRREVVAEATIIREGDR